MDTIALQALVDDLRMQLRGIEETIIVRRGTLRRKSLNELAQAKHEVGHGLVFCAHERSYFVPCKHCKRTQRDATQRREAYLAKITSTTPHNA